MIRQIRQHLDYRQSLAPALSRLAAGPSPAFLALQRQLYAHGIDLTAAVLKEARDLSHACPGLTIGQFIRHLASLDLMTYQAA